VDDVLIVYSDSPARKVCIQLLEFVADWFIIIDDIIAKTYLIHNGIGLTSPYMGFLNRSLCYGKRIELKRYTYYVVLEFLFYLLFLF